MSAPRPRFAAMVTCINAWRPGERGKRWCNRSLGRIGPAGKEEGLRPGGGAVPRRRDRPFRGSARGRGAAGCVQSTPRARSSSRSDRRSPGSVSRGGADAGRGSPRAGAKDAAGGHAGHRMGSAFWVVPAASLHDVRLPSVPGRSQGALAPPSAASALGREARAEAAEDPVRSCPRP